MKQSQGEMLWLWILLAHVFSFLIVIHAHAAPLFMRAMIQIISVMNAPGNNFIFIIPDFCASILVYAYSSGSNESYVPFGGRVNA